MSTINDFRCLWEKNNLNANSHKALDSRGLAQIVRTRTRKHLNVVMRYFWASFALQLLVYAMLSHIVVKYGGDRQILMACLAGIILFIPFTVVLMVKFKAMAVTRLREEPSGASMYVHVARQYELLDSFFRFKKYYELLLIPMATAIATFLTFKLYVPGGVFAYQGAALIIFIVAIISYIAAIRKENKKSFEQPLKALRQLKEEFEITDK